jgi:hypothetical protein
MLRKEVLDTIKHRAASGHALNSGANRGDWLYAAAVRFFGSWGNAVEAAGIRYPSVKQAALDRDELLRRIRKAAEAGPLIRGEHRLLRSNAYRLFGSWTKAVKAAGCELPSNKEWSRERVIESIQEDIRHGLPVTSAAVIERNSPLYGAGRRSFGSWRKALKAVDPSLVKLLWKRSVTAGKASKR